MTQYIPFADYQPDNANLNSDASAEILNAFPDVGGYISVPQLVNLPKPPANVHSLYANADRDGEVMIVVGSDVGLYKFLNGEWSNVSRSDKPYHAAQELGWTFGQFNNLIIACAQGEKPQIWDRKLQKFRDIQNKYEDPNNTKGWTPLPVPYARKVVAGTEFVFLMGTEENPNGLYWSGWKDAEIWESGQLNSSFNLFDTGGEVMDMTQGTSPLVLCRKAIYKMQRGSIDGGFSIVKLRNNIGCFYYNSSAVLGDAIYFIDESGFYAASEAGKIAPIGINRVDEYAKKFLSINDEKFSIRCFAEERGQRIYWVFPDFSLVYDVRRDKWTKLDRGGISACQLPYGATALIEIKGNLDIVKDNIGSFDSLKYLYSTNAPAFLSDGNVGIQCGVPSEAILESNRQGDTGQEMTLINTLQPIIDSNAFDLEGQIVGRMTMGHKETLTNWVKQSKIDGAMRFLWRGRTGKVRIKIPAASEWTKAQGIDILSPASGGRR